MVDELGVDVGHELSEDTVRAPDVSVGGVPADRPGWAKGAPRLAIEYADEGTDENDLREKIREYFDAGAKYVWVVRLVGPRRVHVYTSPESSTEHRVGSVLEAPGVLQEKIPVAALWDRRVALEVSLRNLLLRAGYQSLEHVREEGIEKGIEKGREEGRETEQIRLLTTLFETKLRRALHANERAQLLAEIRAGHADELTRLALDDEHAVLARLNQAR
jgi:hypothetical protein